MEVVIPILAATGLIFASKNDKNKNNDMLNRESMIQSKDAKQSKKEAFTNMGQRQVRPAYQLPNTETIQYQTYPNVSMSIKGNDNAYPSGSAVTDKYYNASLDKRILSKNTQFGNPYNTNNVVTNVNGINPGSQSAVMSLTGKPINVDNFEHNNMVPFFGARVRGSTTGADTHESILDSYSGTGSQKICKEERAPLFAPQANVQYPNGMPDNSDFIKSRMNPGTQMSNVKPWEEIRVAPGLNQGFTSCGSNGFNSGMEARDLWVDRNVDQLRTTNNPKLTYSLENHQGPSYAWNVQQPPDAKTYGRVEKFLPDKFYLNTPDRWFTTTGLEKAQSGRPEEMMKDQNRICTTSEYFGADSNINGTKQHAPEFYEPAKRVSNDLPSVDNVSYIGKNDPTKMDHRGVGRLPTTNRSVTKSEPFLGTMVNGALKAVVAPILEAIRPSRKENVVGTIRPSGNVQNAVGSIGVAYNPADRAPTTIRETTENLLDFNHLNVAPLTEGTGYLVADQQEVYTQRETTEPEYFGTSGGATNQGFVSNLAASNQHNNINKVQKEYTPSGSLSLFNNTENVNIKRPDKDNNMCPWSSGPSASSGLGVMPPSLRQFGELSKMPQYYHESINCERIQPNILDAFRRNPYTQSLHSYVFP
jgi:hypothetical protein